MDVGPAQLGMMDNHRRILQAVKCFVFRPALHLLVRAKECISTTNTVMNQRKLQ